MDSIQRAFTEQKKQEDWEMKKTSRYVIALLANLDYNGLKQFNNLHYFYSISALQKQSVAWVQKGP